jgi:hypothetical protein
MSICIHIIRAVAAYYSDTYKNFAGIYCTVANSCKSSESILHRELPSKKKKHCWHTLVCPFKGKGSVDRKRKKIEPLKDSLTRFSTSGFFHQSIPLGPLIKNLNHFCIWLQIRREILKFATQRSRLRTMQHSTESIRKFLAWISAFLNSR